MRNEKNNTECSLICCTSRVQVIQIIFSQSLTTGVEMIWAYIEASILYRIRGDCFLLVRTTTDSQGGHLSRKIYRADLMEFFELAYDSRQSVYRCDLFSKDLPQLFFIYLLVLG